MLKKVHLLNINLLLSFFILISFLMSCTVNVTSAISCSKVKIDTIKDSYGVADVLGTFTNNCSMTIRYAKIETTCFSSSGNVMDRDPEYVENIPAGGRAYYDSLIDTSSGSISKCNSEITEAAY